MSSADSDDTNSIRSCRSHCIAVNDIADIRPWGAVRKYKMAAWDDVRSVAALSLQLSINLVVVFQLSAMRVQE